MVEGIELLHVDGNARPTLTAKNGDELLNAVGDDRFRFAHITWSEDRGDDRPQAFPTTALRNEQGRLQSALINGEVRSNLIFMEITRQ